MVLFVGDRPRDDVPLAFPRSCVDRAVLLRRAMGRELLGFTAPRISRVQEGFDPAGVPEPAKPSRPCQKTPDASQTISFATLRAKLQNAAETARFGHRRSRGFATAYAAPPEPFHGDGWVYEEKRSLQDTTRLYPSPGDCLGS